MPERVADPSKIGSIAQPPLAILPDPAGLFGRRAERLRALAAESLLAPYLCFLADLAEVQGSCVAPAAPLSAAHVARARDARMPPIDRLALTDDPALAGALDAFLAAAGALAVPEPARVALEAVIAADPDRRRRLLGGVLADAIPADESAPHLWVAAAVQVHAACLAATLDADRLVPIRVGVCPCCGGRPASSVVLGTPRLEGARYAACATCGTLWNEVRIKCLACGSTKGIGYRALGETPTAKAETCDTCGGWVKVLYQNREPALEAIADDVATLGLDVRMRETEWHRAGFDPFLVGF